MESTISEDIETSSMKFIPNLFLSDLLRIDLKYSIRPDLLTAYLQSCKTYETEVLFSIPACSLSYKKLLIILSASTIICISSASILFVNCSGELQSIVKKHFPREKETVLNQDLNSDPYLTLDFCSLFLSLSNISENLEDCMKNASSSNGAQLLRNFIYDSSNIPKESLESQLKEISGSLPSSMLSLSIPNIEDIKNCRSFEILDLGDVDSTYEESFKQDHNYHKTLEGCGVELYKVTEYNESLECSVSEEASDLAAKINDFSANITNSITDKFPKFSIASLSISDTSYQNAYDMYKKSYLDYAEPLEIVNFSSPEKTEGIKRKNLCESPIAGTTNTVTLSESNAFKSVLERKPEYCSCPKCEVF